jgi:large repetitive protein
MKVGVLILLLLTVAAGQSAGTFTATGNLTTNRPFPTATLLHNGKVLITGYGFQVAGAELYDPSTGTFTATGNTATWSAHSATLLADGRVLIAGGYGIGGALSRRAELYDPDTGTFTGTGEMTTARLGFGATRLMNGKVLFLGGEAARPPFLADLTAELYDPATGAFTPTGTFVGAGPVGGSATLLADGRVLVVGAYSGLAGLYDPGTGTFSPTGRPSGLRHSAILLTNGKVLFTGGMGDNGEDIHAELYDPVTGLFNPTGDMTTPRLDHSATLLADGTVLLAGSQRTGSDGGRVFGSAELYDSVTGTFSATGNMITPRFGHAAPLLADGTVLIVGTGSEYSDSVPVPPAELYHPLVLKSAPVLLSVGQTQGAILHAGTFRVVSAADPAIVGEALEIYCTGLIDGSVIPPRVSIGGRVAEILFFGSTPEHAGLNQINVRVPAGLVPGPTIPVRLTYIGRPSNAVTIGVR